MDKCLKDTLESVIPHLRTAISDKLLLQEVISLLEDNLCDVCCGCGIPTSALPCMCEGTGKMSQAARHLRVSLVGRMWR